MKPKSSTPFLICVLVLLAISVVLRDNNQRQQPTAALDESAQHSWDFADSVVVRGKTLIVRGTTADEAFEVLTKEDEIGTVRLENDPVIDGSLLTTHRYKIGNREYKITFARFTPTGPYEIDHIMTKVD